MIEVAVTLLREFGYSNFYITGSICLMSNFGLDLRREPHDIDIILKGDPQTKEDKMLFSYKGILINVFITKEFRFKKTKEINGIPFVDDIEYLINEKMKMSRDKDLKDIDIINKSINQKRNEERTNCREEKSDTEV